jgi:hypothetical protein
MSVDNIDKEYFAWHFISGASFKKAVNRTSFST